MDGSFLQTATIGEVGAAITAIGALGTAAFGLVDASKFVPKLIPSSGFPYIEVLVNQLAPPAGDSIPSDSALTAAAIIKTLYANWVNGMAVADQKSVAKSLIKLRMKEETAPRFAELTGVDFRGSETSHRRGADPNGDERLRPFRLAFGDFY